MTFVNICFVGVAADIDYIYYYRWVKCWTDCLLQNSEFFVFLTDWWLKWVLLERLEKSIKVSSKVALLVLNGWAVFIVKPPTVSVFDSQLYRTHPSGPEFCENEHLIVTTLFTSTRSMFLFSTFWRLIVSPSHPPNAFHAYSSETSAHASNRFSLFFCFVLPPSLSDFVNPRRTEWVLVSKQQ